MRYYNLGLKREAFVTMCLIPSFKGVLKYKNIFYLIYSLNSIKTNKIRDGYRGQRYKKFLCNQ